MTIQYKHSDKFIFEPETFRIILEKKELKLSHKESAVLEQLCSNAMRVVERRTLLTQIWGDRESSDISLNKNILLLRRKFESIGIKNAIDTVPRVGYILKLDLETMQGNSPYHREEIIIDNINYLEIDLENISNKNKFGLKSFLLTVIFIATVSISIIDTYILYKTTDINSHEILLTQSDNQEQGQNILFTEYISDSERDKYVTFSNNIKKDIKHYSLISKEALSFIKLNSSGNVIWQKIFFIDSENEKHSQLLCIAKFINQDAPPPPIGVDKLPGMRVTSLNFYQACGSEDGYLGTMLIKTTDSYHRVSTRIQNISFTDNNGKLLFDIKMLSRVHYDGKKIKLNLKSLNIGYINQDKIQTTPYLTNIFEQITQDNTLLKTVDGKNRIYFSSIFSGILFYSQKI